MGHLTHQLPRLYSFACYIPGKESLKCEKWDGAQCSVRKGEERMVGASQPDQGRLLSRKGQEADVDGAVFKQI